MPDEITQIDREPRPSSSGEAEPLAVRTVDSMRPDDASAADREPDVALARLGESFYARCRRLGSALGLARLDSARLTADEWIFLLFHDAKTNRLSAVLGERKGPDAAALAAGAAAAAEGSVRRTTLPASFAELRDQPGIIAAFVGGPTGTALASSHPGTLRSSELADASALSAHVLDCSRDIGLEATAAELRFAGRRLLLRRSGERWVGVLAVSSVPARWLRELIRHAAHGIEGPHCIEEPHGIEVSHRLVEHAAPSARPVSSPSSRRDPET